MWWHCPPGKPNCALQKRFGSSESKDLVLVGAGPSLRRLRGPQLPLAPSHAQITRNRRTRMRMPQPSRCPTPWPLRVQSRIGAFRRWLQEQPEKVVVAVGHSSYWRHFEEVCRGTKPTHMRNCEVRLIHF